MNLSPPNPSQTPLSRIEGPLSNRVEGFARPYVISWNLTYRCNLACEHCYLDAGGAPQVGTENFADRKIGRASCRERV